MKIRTLTMMVSMAVSSPFLAASSASAQEVFKIALGGTENGSQHVMATTFVDELEKLTEGSYTAELYTNSQLGSEQNTVNDAAMGLLDFSVVAINNITPFSPTTGLFTLPYVFGSNEDVVEVVQSDVGDQVVENTVRDAGVRIVGWTLSGFRFLTNSKQPVTRLDDLHGLVIRVPKNEIMIDTYQAWGVNPTPMAWSEVFTALQQKVVDGQDLSMIDIEKTRFYEVQDYLTELHYNFLLEPLIVSESVFQSQSDEVKEAILQAGEVATLRSYEFLTQQEELARAELIRQGMEITSLEDESEWKRRAIDEVWPDYYDSVSLDLINQTLESLGRETL